MHPILPILVVFDAVVVVRIVPDKIKVLIDFTKIHAVVAAVAVVVVVIVVVVVVVIVVVVVGIFGEEKPRVHLLVLVAEDGGGGHHRLSEDGGGRDGDGRERVRGVHLHVARHAQRGGVGAARERGRGALAGLAHPHALVAGRHAVGRVHPRVARRAQVRRVRAAVHHARRRAAPVARPRPWAAAPLSSSSSFASNSNLLVEHVATKIIIHERSSLACGSSSFSLHHMDKSIDPSYCVCPLSLCVVCVCVFSCSSTSHGSCGIL
ncbi:Os06g0274950 [Oryza sativa Japonica Group]|uniref:Os06g0274950 protein n=1 Tax=Oryza sativa subsp. japonica TaxID=39947 RepID=A0A0P0WVA1_ORYSJ|nr:Os06g0274950 [Oryza sativa Japonica Group]